MQLFHRDPPQRLKSLASYVCCGMLLAGAGTLPAVAQMPSGAPPLIKERHLGTTRSGAASMPRSEADQAVVDGWPVYRTERGQQAFNDAMATLKATDGITPGPNAFKSCPDFQCALQLPPLSPEGWIKPGRLWVSANEYILFVESPRQTSGRDYRRRPSRSMRYFVFHEFHNSSRNTDTFDTISSHKGAVFVPFYLSKPQRDAYGRRFVMVVQVAPFDVQSIHATNHGSAGPGVEVARNTTDPVEPLQNLAGSLLAHMVRATAPHLRAVNHRGIEGQPMLDAYQRYLQIWSRPAPRSYAPPFVAAIPQRLASARGHIDEVVTRGNRSPRLAVVERSFLPPRSGSGALAQQTPALVAPIQLVQRTQPAAPPPQLIEPVRPAPPRNVLR